MNDNTKTNADQFFAKHTVDGSKFIRPSFQNELSSKVFDKYLESQMPRKHNFWNFRIVSNLAAGAFLSMLFVTLAMQKAVIAPDSVTRIISDVTITLTQIPDNGSAIVTGSVDGANISTYQNITIPQADGGDITESQPILSPSIEATNNPIPTVNTTAISNPTTLPTATPTEVSTPTPTLTVTPITKSGPISVSFTSQIILSGMNSGNEISLSWNYEQYTPQYGAKIIITKQSGGKAASSESLVIISDNATTYTMTGEAGKTYTFQICTFDQNKNCELTSNQVTITLPSGTKS